MKKYISNAFKGLLCILIYLFSSNLELGLLDIFNVDYNSLPLNMKVTYLIMWEIVIIGTIALILNKQLSKDINDMKKNHKSYFKKYFKFWLISIGIMMMSNAIIGILNKGAIAGNEATLRESFKISPIYIFFSSVIYAPICEELIFRRSFRNMIPNKFIFILVSGLVFGGLHVIGSYSNPADLLYLIPYCAPGIAFAYMLADSDNVLISMGLHFMHNGILMSLQFLALILGVSV